MLLVEHFRTCTTLQVFVSVSAGHQAALRTGGSARGTQAAREAPSRCDRLEHMQHFHDPHISPQFTRPTKASTLLLLAPLPRCPESPLVAQITWRHVNCDARRPSTASSRHRHHRRRRRRSSTSPPFHAPLQVIHFRNLPFDLTGEEIREFCAPWGTVVAVKEKVGAGWRGGAWWWCNGAMLPL